MLLYGRNQDDAVKQLSYILKKIDKVGFPRGSVLENLLANVGDTGSIPDLGRPHMLQSNKAPVPQLLSLGSTAREQQPLSPCAATTEDHAFQRRPLSTQEKPLP